MVDFITEAAKSLFSVRIKSHASSFNFYKHSTMEETLISYRAFAIHYVALRADNTDLVRKYVEDTAGSDDEETEEEERREGDSKSDFGSHFAKLCSEELFQLVIGNTMFMPYMLNISDLIASLDDKRKLELHNCLVMDLTQEFHS